jgi:DNA polymerase
VLRGGASPRAAPCLGGAVYLTNVVKHFKWRRPSGGGKRRLHDKPTWQQVGACLPWLESELEVVRPDLVVCLGATAAQALLGRSFRVTRDRGRVLESPLAARVLATVHPSSILRARDEAERAAQLDDFVRDLRAAARALAESRAGRDKGGPRPAQRRRTSQASMKSSASG